MFCCIESCKLIRKHPWQCLNNGSGCICYYRQFQNRQLRNDEGQVQQVLTHSDLVQYLQQESGGSRGYLAFEGMNQVVFGNTHPVTSK